MTSAAPTASLHAAVEKTGAQPVVAAKVGSMQQAMNGNAVAAAAAPSSPAAPSRRPARPLRRLREGEAFILDINGGDRQCLMHARASR